MPTHYHRNLRKFGYAVIIGASLLIFFLLLSNGGATYAASTVQDAAPSTIKGPLAETADLVIAKDAPDSLLAGDLLTYTLTVTNTGPYSATNVIVTDTLPAELDFISAASSRGECAAPVGRVITCTLAGDGPPNILLVSNDGNVTGYYTEALTTLGYNYILFEAPGGPTATKMSEYELVIWAGGEFGSPNKDNDEPELAAYLDGGGRLFISAQDYHFNEGLTPLMQSYLGVDNVSGDVGVTNPITGANDFAGLGPYTTSFPGSDWSDDITPNSSGNVAFVDDDGHRIGVNTNTTVFFAFPWEAIANHSAADGQAVMQAVIAHLTSDICSCLAPNQPEVITITTRAHAAASGIITNTARVIGAQTDPQPDDNSDAAATTILAAADLRLRKNGPAVIIAGEQLRYTLTFSNAGSLTAADVVITDVIPLTLTPLNVSSSGAAITATGGVDFIWQAADLAPGDGGVITITARADQGLPLDTVVTNTAEIGGSGAEGNLENNRSTIESVVPSCMARVFDGVRDGPIHPTVQAAVDEAAAGQVVKVAGACVGVNRRGGLPQTIYISKSLTVQGGYTRTNWSAPDPGANPTTLDAEGEGRVVYITNTVAVTLDGLRLINGQARGLGGGTYDSDAGGGVYNPVADLTLRRTQVLSNGVSGGSFGFGGNEAQGGGVYNGVGRLRLVESRLADNRLDVSNYTYGGGLYNESGVVTLTNTIVVSNASSGGGDAGSSGHGGGLYNASGAMRLTSSSVAQNTANLIGGGIYNAEGVLTLESSAVTGNLAAQAGGIYSGHRLRLNNSTVDNNEANASGFFRTPAGGGILAEDTITITNSAISHNRASNANPNDGGGLAMKCGPFCATQATIINSTFSGNHAGRNGGAIYQSASGASYGVGQVTTILTHTTIVSNSADSGGGIYNEDDDSGTAAVRYASAILAGNSAVTGDADCHNANGTLTSGDYNLLGATCPADGGNDLAFGGSLDSVLEPLALNLPGATETHALATGSPATDQIPPGANGCGVTVTADQRGAIRPQNSDCDIGAYETNYVLSLSKRATSATPRPGQRITYTLSVTGSDVTDSDVIISDTVPADLSYVPGSIAGGDSRDAGAAPALTWTINTLAPRTSVSVTFAVTVNADLALGALITNTAEATSDGASKPTTATHTLIAAAPVITAAKTDAFPGVSAEPGAAITYAIVITNSGNGDATGVTVRDTIDAHTTYVADSLSITPPLAPVSADPTAPPGDELALIEDPFTLAAGQTVTVAFAVTIDQPLPAGVAHVQNQATITGANFDAVLSVDPAPHPNVPPVNGETITPLSVPVDLVITKTSGAAAIEPGAMVTYTIIAYNHGPNDVAGAIVSDTFPAALHSVAWDCAAGPGATCTASGAGDISDIIDLAAGSRVTYTASAALDDAATGALTNTATVTPTAAINIDPTPDNNRATDTTTIAETWFAVSDVTQAEGDVGTTAFNFIISRTTTAGTASVAYATADGTALAGQDYISAPTTTIQFSAGGRPTHTVTISVTGDAYYEHDETFFVRLSNPVNGAISDGEGIGTIINDDAPPILSINDITVTEDVGTAFFTVTLDTASGLDAIVDYATADGTARAPEDYLSRSGVLTIPAGALNAAIAVPIVDDALAEDDEYFTVILSNPINATLGKATGSGVIVDDDTAIVDFSRDHYTIGEADGPATITVTLSAPAAFTVTADYISGDGTATAESDYIPISGTVEFAPGQTIQLLSLAIIDDTLAEADETVILSLTHAVSAALGTAHNPAALTIIDDDIPAVRFSQTAYSAGEADGSAAISVTLSMPSAFTATVAIASRDGTATAGSDYTPISDTLTFPAGQTLVAATLPILDDDVAEEDETVILALSAPGNAVLTAPATATLTIIDDDTASVIITPTSGLTTTEDGGQATFTVQLTSRPVAPVTITLTSDDPSEGTVAPNALYFNPAPTKAHVNATNWATAQTATVTGVDDTLHDGDIQYTIQTGLISDDPFYAMIEPEDVTLINLDNEVAALIVHQLYLPLILRQSPPDLVVRNLTVAPPELWANQPATITVVIENIGGMPTPGPFWVDLYINPDPALMPPQVNQTWDVVGSQYGIAWWVTPTLATGEQLTLTSLSYPADFGNWPGHFICDGPHTLYAQVDSYSSATTYGAIGEADETNNVYGPLHVQVKAAPSQGMQSLCPAPELQNKARRDRDTISETK